jgi:hypothetical protein
MPLAKSRDWTEAEVQEAIDQIKKEPGLWEKLEYVEGTTAEFRGSEIGETESSVLD